MLAKIANRKESKQSNLGLHCLLRPFWQVSSVPNFKTLTVVISPDKAAYCVFTQFLGPKNAIQFLSMPTKCNKNP